MRKKFKFAQGTIHPKCLPKKSFKGENETFFLCEEHPSNGE